LAEGRREKYSPLMLSSGVWKHENQPFWQQLLVTGTTAASCEGGSSITGASTIGAVATFFFGSSFSLKKKQKSKTLCASRQKEKYMNKLENTHESKASKSSSSSSRAEASPTTFL
jgi:hypothetical protein